MSLFKKKEITHFERDENTGEVVDVVRDGVSEGKISHEYVRDPGGGVSPVRVHYDPEYRKAKSGRQLMDEYYVKHPEKRHPTLTRIGQGAAKLDKRIVDYNRRSNIMNPQRKSRARYPPVRRPSRSNANPFGATFDYGLMGQRTKSKKKKNKTQYKVIGGKAYPIAGTGGKKKKPMKKKSRSSNSFFDFDVMDNSNRWL